MEKLLISREEAAQAISVSVDLLDRLADGGYLRRYKIGARTLYDPDGLLRLRNRLRIEGRINPSEGA